MLADEVKIWMKSSSVLHTSGCWDVIQSSCSFLLYLPTHLSISAPLFLWNFDSSFVALSILGGLLCRTFHALLSFGIADIQC